MTSSPQPDTAEFARLSRNWIFWSGMGQLGNPSVTTSCADCAILFRSDYHSVHLRHDGETWIVDTVDDRGRLHAGTATFSDYALAEKYLVWIWAGTARSVAGATVLDTKFYDAGVDPGVAAVVVTPGIVELRSPAGRAVLMEPYATIFSHLMRVPEQDIEAMALAGLGRTAPI